MKGILIFLLAIALFLLSTAVEGEDWEFLGKNKTQDVSVYIDKESIKYVSKTVIRVWVKTLYEKPSPYESKFINESLSHREHYCNEGKYKLIQVSFFYTDGKSDSFTLEANNRRYVIPNIYVYVRADTFEDYIHKYICNKSKYGINSLILTLP